MSTPGRAASRPASNTAAVEPAAGCAVSSSRRSNCWRPATKRVFTVVARSGSTTNRLVIPGSSPSIAANSRPWDDLGRGELQPAWRSVRDHRGLGAGQEPDAMSQRPHKEAYERPQVVRVKLVQGEMAVTGCKTRAQATGP